MSGKNSATARQAVKAARRAARRKGRMPNWVEGDVRSAAAKLITRTGNGGTDKSGSKKRSIVYYSDKDARR